MPVTAFRRRRDPRQRMVETVIAVDELLLWLRQPDPGQAGFSRALGRLCAGASPGHGSSTIGRSWHGARPP
jgi:hypothetical protein